MSIEISVDKEKTLGYNKRAKKDAVTQNNKTGGETPPLRKSTIVSVGAAFRRPLKCIIKASRRKFI
jgi:hypothetical protein